VSSLANLPPEFLPQSFLSKMNGHYLEMQVNGFPSQAAGDIFFVNQYGRNE
jgi:hypothetical protein